MIFTETVPLLIKLSLLTVPCFDLMIFFKMSRGLIFKASKQMITSQKPCCIHGSMNPKDGIFTAPLSLFLLVCSPPA